MECMITWKVLWDIISEVEYHEGNSEVAMGRILTLLQQVPGQLYVKESQLYYIPNQYNTNYKYSTSVIGSEEERYQVENYKKELDKKLDHEDAMKWVLDQVNEEFEGYDDYILNIFFDRYINNYSVSEIREKYGLGSTKYYLYIETGEYLFQEAMLIRELVAWKIMPDGSYENIYRKHNEKKSP